MKVNLELIKKKRLEKGLSLLYMSKKLGFATGANYLKYESGKYELKADMIPIIAESLGCKITDLYA